MGPEELAQRPQTLELLRAAAAEERRLAQVVREPAVEEDREVQLGGDAPLLVREATAEDAAAVGEVHAEASRVAHRDVFEGRWLRQFVEQRRERWADVMADRDFASHTLLLAVRDDRVGAMLEPDQALQNAPRRDGPFFEVPRVVPDVGQERGELAHPFGRRGPAEVGVTQPLVVTDQRRHRDEQQHALDEPEGDADGRADHRGTAGRPHSGQRSGVARRS